MKAMTNLLEHFSDPDAKRIAVATIGIATLFGVVCYGISRFDTLYGASQCRDLKNFQILVMISLFFEFFVAAVVTLGGVVSILGYRRAYAKRFNLSSRAGAFGQMKRDLVVSAIILSAVFLATLYAIKQWC